MDGGIGDSYVIVPAEFDGMCSPGRRLATVYDIMVHYGQPEPPKFPVTPQLCSKCGSHRTQIIGRLEDGKTLIVRCNACGAHATVVSTKPNAA
jgi:hypothetical protein